jgi:hypothetical protein
MCVKTIELSLDTGHYNNNTPMKFYGCHEHNICIDDRHADDNSLSTNTGNDMKSTLTLCIASAVGHGERNKNEINNRKTQ